MYIFTLYTSRCGISHASISKVLMMVVICKNDERIPKRFMWYHIYLVDDNSYWKIYYVYIYNGLLLCNYVYLYLHYHCILCCWLKDMKNELDILFDWISPMRKNLERLATEYQYKMTSQSTLFWGYNQTIIWFSFPIIFNLHKSTKIIFAFSLQQLMTRQWGA